MCGITFEIYLTPGNLQQFNGVCEVTDSHSARVGTIAQAQAQLWERTHHDDDYHSHDAFPIQVEKFPHIIELA